jgi:hypothetical protein
MLLRYLKTSLIFLFSIIIISIFKNFIDLHKFRGIYPFKIEIALIYEATLDTRSDILRIFDKLYLNKKKDIKEIKKVYLDINEGDLEKSLNNLKNKKLKRVYFKSSINLDFNDEQFRASQFRLRGRSDWHHRIDKPSLRIKLKKFEPYNKMRHLNFSIPEGRSIIENYYADFLSKKIGLIGHYGEFVDLYINKKNYGIYHLHSREDESLIRLNSRMPGPLLLGQNLKKNRWNIDEFEIVNIESINRNKNIFEKMINEINIKKNEWKNWDNFWNLVNFDQTAKHIALNSILGIIHNDYTHNHEFFFDRTLGKIEPIISDAMSLGTFVYPWHKDRISFDTFMTNEQSDYTIPINQKTNPFLNTILMDTHFYHAKNEMIDLLIKNELSYKNQKKLLNKIFNEIDYSVLRDPNKRYLIKRLNGWQIAKSSNFEYEKFKDNVFKFIKNRNIFLDKILRQKFIKYDFFKLKEFPNNRFLIIDYKGELPLQIQSTVLGEFEIYNPKNKIFFKYYEKNLNLHTGLKISKNINKFTNEKIGDDIFHDHQYDIDFQTYLIKVNDNFDLNKFLANLETLNSISNLIKINKNLKNFDNLDYNKETLHIWSKDYKYLDDIIFETGDHEIKKDIIVGKNQKLIINEGANLFLWPNVSIFSEGKTFIDGGDKGIIIKNKFENKPWANLSIIGINSNGSYLKNVKISGGSSKDVQNILFSGMVNIFWNKNIILENLEISKNSLFDDVLHFTKSQGKIKNLKIFDCLSDCIDMDYSDYYVENLKCEYSGNDGLDLMESKVVGKNLIFNYNMDKSISVGEASNIKVNGLKISNSEIGIASKDDSEVILENISIIRSNVGLDSYRKNSRYNYSGVFRSTNHIFKENRLDLRFSDPAKIKFDFSKINYQVN